MPASHSAIDAAVGYYYQGVYALLILLQAGDDAEVLLEEADDVVLEGTQKTLHQLKHSLGADPRPLSVKCRRFGQH